MDDDLDAEKPSVGLKFCRRVLHPLTALWAVSFLLSWIGWTGEIVDWQHLGTLVLGVIFAVERVWIFNFLKPRGKERRRLGAHAVLGMLVLAVAISLAFQSPASSGAWFPKGFVFIHLSVIASGMASMIHHQTRFTARAFHPGLLLILSFLGIIVVGTLLLKMPLCVVPGETCSWLDAFFTSTSAVCVTGLTVQDTALFFSHTGQMVILLLIQIGGLGIMTLTFFAAVVLFEGLSLHDRLLIGRMLQEDRLARIGQTLAFIVSMTLVCEGIGAVVLFAGMDGDMNLQTRLFHSVFHSVSAFCNAGFSTLPGGMTSEVVNGNWIWQGCIMLLIVIGGLGALVNEDLANWIVAKMRRLMGKEVAYQRLRIHTRLVLVVTAILIFGGAGLILVSEFLLWSGPENGGTVLTAMFHSVTARTAGFNTVPMTQIGTLTVQLLMILMIIGGSPGGTAGGMRTTVFAVGLGHLWNQLRMGRRGMIAFNRTIPRDLGSQALGLMVLTGMWLVANFILFQILEAGSGISGTTLLFELISAFATVGLSLDLTQHLSEGGKTLLIVNMFVGRIGLLTVLATLIPMDKRPASGKPTEDILLN